MSSRIKMDLTGKKFGRLKVLARADRGGWLCLCDCGNQKIVNTHNLTNGLIKSCGCYNKERLLGTHINQKHGMSRTRIYITWRNMRVRCTNPKDKRYASYGGRGITVCEEWNTFEPFRDWAIANGYRDDLTIDRIDTNGNYEPSNCRFITRAENNKNRRNWRIKK